MDKISAIDPVLAPAVGLTTEAAPARDCAGTALSPFRAGLQLACTILGYIGVYLCRKNFAVAVPLLVAAFSTNRAQVGAIESYGTLTYAVGKLFWGPNIVDRFGGRVCFFVLLAGVAIFGGLS